MSPHIRLTLGGDDDAIEGVVVADEGTEWAFVGWLGLIDAVEKLRRALAEAVDPAAEEGTA